VAVFQDSKVGPWARGTRDGRDGKSGVDVDTVELLRAVKDRNQGLDELVSLGTVRRSETARVAPSQRPFNAFT